MNTSRWSPISPDPLSTSPSAWMFTRAFSPGPACPVSRMSAPLYRATLRIDHSQTPLGAPSACHTPQSLPSIPPISYVPLPGVYSVGNGSLEVGLADWLGLAGGEVCAL